jgi:uroporphyrinogen decarboxylase
VLTPRERVLCALEHEEPDRVPVFIGACGVTTMLIPAYRQLKQYLGLPAGEIRVMSRAFQYAWLDEEQMVRFGSDARYIMPAAAPSPLAVELSPTSFVDEWGISWQMQPDACYYEITNSPLRNATIDDLERYPWPDLAAPERFRGLAAEAQAIQVAGFAVVAAGGVQPFERCLLLRGVDNWLADLAADPDFAHALLRKVTDLMAGGIAGLLDEAGEYVDVVATSDDLGSQNAPLMSPRMYRRLIQPYQAELMAQIKRRSKARILFHSDGDIYPLLNDIIETGIDILNPVQVSAREMGDTARLKREFGHRISFCGGIDTGQILPSGTPDDVRREVRQRIHDLAPRGGYILAAVHCIQPDVPPANVRAMFDEGLRAGHYPLTV